MERSCLLLVLALAACSTPETAVHDLKAIHGADSFRHLSEARLYGVHDRFRTSLFGRIFGAPEPELGSVSDPVAIDQACLEELAAVSPEDVRWSVEAVLWGSALLRWDEEPQSRRSAAELLLRFGQSWQSALAEAPAADAEVDLPAALTDLALASGAIGAPDYRERVLDALDRLDRSPLPPLDEATGVLAALGRLAQGRLYARTMDRAALSVRRLGARVIRASLQLGTHDTDRSVRRFCEQALADLASAGDAP